MMVVVQILLPYYKVSNYENPIKLIPFTIYMANTVCMIDIIPADAWAANAARASAGMKLSVCDNWFAINTYYAILESEIVLSRCATQSVRVRLSLRLMLVVNHVGSL